ncbi:MAG: DNA-binding transcriptional regulator [Nisaea sp.]|uniref:helix-turn-helix domain-containing protein n=1 Tax=Nisaea sp. TaxID=2024842 RepID=UPI001B11F4D6|nr:DNA-binding transcriptional regulator [Nisaea sp.]MBO6561496.1 DNA-binding transcriptional regulator [Nisaea sp.]
MPKAYNSKVMATIHETVSGFYESGLLDKRTLREFDEICLTPIREFSASEIRAIRENELASQAVFARYLNVSKNLISQWERGEKKPSGASLKLLTLVAKNGLSSIA